jgi:hypothetical protein
MSKALFRGNQAAAPSEVAGGHTHPPLTAARKQTTTTRGWPAGGVSAAVAAAKRMRSRWLAKAAAPAALRKPRRLACPALRIGLDLGILLGLAC